jgi:hypothetical protein
MTTILREMSYDSCLVIVRTSSKIQDKHHQKARNLQAEKGTISREKNDKLSKREEITSLVLSSLGMSPCF